jgi:hypothetical protein
MIGNLLNSTFQYLQNHPTQNMYGRELVGDVIPHILIARTKDERIDTSVIQLTNTLLPVAAGYSLDKAYDLIQKTIQPVTSELSKQWYVLGKSMALYGFLASIPVANAFIRNWVTAKRTGTSGFIDMVGEKASPANQEKQRRIEDTIRSHEQTILKILGVGAVISASVFAATQLAIRGKWKFGKVAQTLSDYLALPQDKYENFAKPAKHLLGKIALPPVLIWGIPIYAGLFSASRDQFEFKELVLRFATFLTSFFILPKLAKDIMIKRTPDVLKKAMGSAENAAIVAEMVTTSILFAVLPPLVNIYLTRRRVQRENTDPYQGTLVCPPGFKSFQ